MLLGSNEYDSLLYCFGKGPSDITVFATPGVGNTVTIQGTVSDVSGGTKQLIADNKFSIIPAVSDADMTAWMEYLYMQKPMPSNAKGVSVTLYVSDQNGQVVSTLQATTDLSGHYAASWTPPSTGLYKITASFDGTKSYYASTGVSSISVGVVTSQSSAQPTATPSSSPSASPSNTEAPPPKEAAGVILYIEIASVVVIIIVAVAAIILRRRK
jgi:hypothetical protein